jgi:protoheme IX farnesyltransferase
VSSLPSPPENNLGGADRIRKSNTTAGTGTTITSTREKEKASLPLRTKAYLELAKAKLSTLVVTTTVAGFVAAGGPIATQWDVFLACTLGTALCSSSAAALNQVFEIERDMKMKRTQQRPLVTGVLTAREATLAASLWGVTGTTLLATYTDPVTATLGAGNIALYAGLYTYMKPRTIYNTWVGAIVGAIPPVMGWTAATGGSLLDVEALLLGSTLFIWQMPHFFALSYMHRIDYQRGGFAMVPCLEQDGEKTANLITRYTWYMSTLPFVATFADVTNSMFALEGIALNSYALYVAYKFHGDRTNANARKVFLTSLWYLPTFMMLFLLHSKVWDEDKEKDDIVSKFLSDHIHWARNKGRELCIHETATAETPQDDKVKVLCPVTIGSRASRASVDTVTAAVVTSTSVDMAHVIQEQNPE